MFEDILGPREKSEEDQLDEIIGELGLEDDEDCKKEAEPVDTADVWGNVDTSNDAEDDCDGCDECYDDGSGC